MPLLNHCARMVGSNNSSFIYLGKILEMKNLEHSSAENLKKEIEAHPLIEDL